MRSLANDSLTLRKSLYTWDENSFEGLPIQGETRMADQPQTPASGDEPKDKLAQSADPRSASAGNHPPEKSLWRGRYSPKAMYGTWILCGLATIVGLVLLVKFGGRHPAIWPAGGAVMLALWCWSLGTYLVRRYSIRYELTSRLFIHQTGILVRRTDRIEVIFIDDVILFQGIIQRLLGVGTIQLTSSDKSNPVLSLVGIDQVVAVSNMIDDVRRDERRRRSLHVAGQAPTHIV